MKNPAVKYVVAAVLVVLVLGLQLSGVLKKDDEPAPPTPTPVPQVTATTDPEPTGTSTPEPSTTDPTTTETPDDAVDDFDEQLVVAASIARSTWSWNDDEPLDWANRLAAISTDAYAEELGNLPTTSVEESEWESGVLAPRATTRIEGVKVSQLDGSAKSGTVDVVVAYDVLIAYELPEKISSHGSEGTADSEVPTPEAGEWGPLYAQKIHMRFVLEDGEWLVDEIGYPSA